MRVLAAAAAAAAVAALPRAQQRVLLLRAAAASLVARRTTATASDDAESRFRSAFVHAQNTSLAQALRARQRVAALQQQQQQKQQPRKGSGSSVQDGLDGGGSASAAAASSAQRARKLREERTGDGLAATMNSRLLVGDYDEPRPYAVGDGSPRSLLPFGKAANLLAGSSGARSGGGGGGGGSGAAVWDEDTNVDEETQGVNAAYDQHDDAGGMEDGDWDVDEAGVGAGTGPGLGAGAAASAEASGVGGGVIRSSSSLGGGGRSGRLRRSRLDDEANDDVGRTTRDASMLTWEGQREDDGDDDDDAGEDLDDDEDPRKRGAPDASSRENEDPDVQELKAAGRRVPRYVPPHEVLDEFKSWVEGGMQVDELDDDDEDSAGDEIDGDEGEAGSMRRLRAVRRDAMGNPLPFESHISDGLENGGVMRVRPVNGEHIPPVTPEELRKQYADAADDGTGANREQVDPDLPVMPYAESIQLIDVSRSSNMTKGGRRASMSAIVLTGNKNGYVGIGYGKGEDVSVATDKAIRDSQRRMVMISSMNGTIPWPCEARIGGAIVRIWPRARGTGVVACRPLQHLFRLAGITDVTAKAIGSRTKHVMLRAGLRALMQSDSAEEIAERRGVTLREVRTKAAGHTKPMVIMPHYQL